MNLSSSVFLQSQIHPRLSRPVVFTARQLLSTPKEGALYTSLYHFLLLQVGGFLVKLLDKNIIEMIFFPVVNEVCRVLAEGIALKASDLDIVVVMGMRFPQYRGGLIFWVDSLGSKYSKLEEWKKTYGDFFKLCAYLAERVVKGAFLGDPMEQAKSRL